MRISLVVSPYLGGDRIFKKGLHRDDIFHRFRVLKRAIEGKGHVIATHDLIPIKSADKVLYASNMPSKLPNKSDVHKSFLILSESEFIRPDNYDRHKHIYFNKIFTWHDKFVDNDKYLKLNYAHKFRKNIPDNVDRKLCVLIAANKKAVRMKEFDLYRERVEAVRWFEKYHLNEFDLYGVGWDQYTFSGFSGASLLNRISKSARPVSSFIRPGFPSYGGEINSKFDTLSKYKFSICYENVKGIPGYITEKIFDSFNAGCVPIYLGAPNIYDYIPNSCFIDKSKYNSYSDLYSFIKSISDSQYQRYVSNIRAFLASSAAVQFESSGFSESVMKGMGL